MTVFMPNKDTAFALAQAAHLYIAEYNKKTDSTENWIFPEFPLYAYFPEDDAGEDTNSQTTCSCTIEQIALDEKDKTCYFPVQLELLNGTCRTLRIVFAKARHALCHLPIQAEGFPLPQRVFRLARLEQKETSGGKSWQVFDERWVKIPKNENQ